MNNTPYTEWVISTVAGNGTVGLSGDGGPATDATLNNPFDMVFDADGNLVFTDTFNHCIRRIVAGNGAVERVAGTGAAGNSGDGGLAINANFNEPYGITIDSDGNLYTADRRNAVVRKIEAATAIVSTFAGNGEAAYSGDAGPANQAGMVEPNGLTFSPDGSHLYVADVADNRVRVIDMARNTIATFAGTGDAVHDGDGGPAVSAGIFGARAVVCRPADSSVYIMERQGSSIRLVDSEMGTISTIASTGKTGYGGDGGPAATAIFDRPKEISLDADGNILVVDTENHAIRLIDVRADRVSTIAGNGNSGFNGDGIAATDATLGRPHGVAVGPDGAFYIGDTENNRIRRVAPPT